MQAIKKIIKDTIERKASVQHRAVRGHIEPHTLRDNVAVEQPETDRGWNPREVWQRMIKEPREKRNHIRNESLRKR